MTWTTKALERVREYVVIKHRLKDINGFICGVKFRGGYAVVEKGSKAYLQLKSLPFIKSEPEFPLLHLRKLAFVTRALDVKLIYGTDVYYQYLKELNPVIEVELAQRVEQAEIKHVESPKHNCAYRKKDGTLCRGDAMKGSPSGYCKYHIIEDKDFPEVGIQVPRLLTNKEKAIWKAKVVEKLEKHYK